MWEHAEQNERSSIKETQRSKPADLITEVMNEWMKASETSKVDRLEKSFQQDAADNTMSQFPSSSSLLKQLGVLRAESFSVDPARTSFKEVNTSMANVRQRDIEVVASHNQLPNGITLDREAHRDQQAGRSRIGDVLSVAPSDTPNNPIKVMITRNDRGELAYAVSDPGRTTHGKTERLADGKADVSLRDGTIVKIENGRIAAVRRGDEQFNIKDKKAS